MKSAPLLDCAGRRRSPAITSTFHRGLPPRNNGLRYPPDPSSVEEIVAVMHAAGDSVEGIRLRGIIVVLRRAGLRISEALVLNETDLDPERGSLIVCHGKGDEQREVGMDRWAWMHLDPWLELRRNLPVGRLFCVVRGPTRGRPCAPAGIRAAQLQHAAQTAGVRRRFAPHQPGHAQRRGRFRGPPVTSSSSKSKNTFARHYRRGTAKQTHATPSGSWETGHQSAVRHRRHPSACPASPPRPRPAAPKATTQAVQIR